MALRGHIFRYKIITSANYKFYFHSFFFIFFTSNCFFTSATFSLLPKTFFILSFFFTFKFFFLFPTLFFTCTNFFLLPTVLFISNFFLLPTFFLLLKTFLYFHYLFLLPTFLSTSKNFFYSICGTYQCHFVIPNLPDSYAFQDTSSFPMSGFALKALTDNLNPLTIPTKITLSPTQWPNTKKKSFKRHAHSLAHIWLYQ